MKIVLAVGLAGYAVLLAGGVAGFGAGSDENPEVAAARKARDHSDANTLTKLIEGAHKEANQQNSAAAYERLALFEFYLCEAGHARNDDKLITQAAEDGVKAAEEAAKLNPNSSEAHRLQGDLLGELIPHVFAGGMRYGQRSTNEIDKAIELDRSNVNAYIARAVEYFYTPGAFGGSREKAVEVLKKGIEIDPRSDSAHIWLAQVYLAEKKKVDALREIQEAQRLNPERDFAKYVYGQITGKKINGN